VFLVFGFIYEDKGIDIAIRALGRAAGRLEGAILLVTGPVLPGRGPPHLASLRELASRLPSTVSVRFRPEHVDDEEASRQFAAADAVLLPYRRSVGTSAVLHRALGEGRAAVSTIAGWYRSPGAGLLEVPPGDEEGFAEAMVALARDGGLRDRLEAEARRSAEERRWSLVAEDTLNTYRKVSTSRGTDAVGPSS
jgi:glycosyltransferase involved in cell wall biosynthesis